MNPGLLQNNVSTVALNSRQSTTFGYELPIQNLIKSLNSQRPCYMPTDRHTVVDKRRYYETFGDLRCVEYSLKTHKLDFLNITSQAPGIRTIRQFDKAVKNNIHIKNNDALKFVK